MKDKSIKEKVQRGRRFREAVDGPMIRKWYAKTITRGIFMCGCV